MKHQTIFTRMAVCPDCRQRIPFRTVLLAAYPIWIACPSCKAKLVGNRLIKIQGAIAPVLAVIVVVAIMSTPLSLQQQMGLAFPGAAAFALLNVFITLKWGRYLPRKP
jgi:uncharacterized protein YbaR (Trm112 family)